MSVSENHYVQFHSPGTLFNESSSKKIDSWDVKEAIKLSKNIKERYDATPFGFNFCTFLESDPIPDGRGGTLRVESKKIKSSGTYFLGGRIRTYDDVVADNLENEDILRSNMKGNNWWVVVENTNSYKTTQEFKEDSVLLNPETGEVEATFGKFRAYCDKMNAWKEEEDEKMMRQWEEERKQREMAG